MEIANTRRTCAAIYNKQVAEKLAKDYWPCALPADLHLQYLLKKNKIPGIWPKERLIEHTSDTDDLDTSILKGVSS